MANTANSLADSICPTYGAATISLMSGTITQANITNQTGDFLNDAASKTGANGYTNNFSNITAGVARVGGFNNAWVNGCLSQNVTPVYNNGLLSFGETGRQS